MIKTVEVNQNKTCGYFFFYERIKMKTKIDHFFEISKRQSSISREIIAGLAVFFAMIYILPVNAEMLAFNIDKGTGMSGATVGSVFVATAIASAIATLIMGLVANYPIALSAGMGMNAVIAFTVCGVLGYSGEEALALIILAGVIFLLLSLTKVRSQIVKAIPHNLKIGVSCGLGFFIAYLGLKNAGIISFTTTDGFTTVSLVKINENPSVLLAFFGIFLVFALMASKRKISRFAVIIAMTTTALVGIILGYLGIANMPSFDWSSGTSGSMKEMGNTLFLGFKGIPKVLVKPEAYAIIFTLIFVNLFDTTATLLAVGKDAKAIDKETGELINGQKAVLADAFGAVVGGILGTSTVTSFVESSVGVESGARTGLSAVTVAILFLLSLVLYPVFTIFAGKAGSLITALALVAVGAAMFNSLKELNWDDKVSIIASFITILFMVLTSSISDGIGIGFISYVIMMLASGKAKKVSIFMYIISFLFIINYIITFTILT